MRTIRIEDTGLDLKMKSNSKWNRRLLGTPKEEQSWSTPDRRSYKTSAQIDREAELLFERWAGNLNEMICLDDSDEAPKSVYAWGKELAELEEIEMDRQDDRVIRKYRIARMLIDAGLIWRGGPCWWRTL